MPPAFRAINNPADGDKGWSMGSSDNARLIQNLNLIISFFTRGGKGRSRFEGHSPSPVAMVIQKRVRVTFTQNKSPRFSKLLSEIAAFISRAGISCSSWTPGE